MLRKKKILGIGRAAVMRLAITLPEGRALFLDRYFTSADILDQLAGKMIAATGTIINNRLPKYFRVSSEKELK